MTNITLKLIDLKSCQLWLVIACMASHPCHLDCLRFCSIDYHACGSFFQNWLPYWQKFFSNTITIPLETLGWVSWFVRMNAKLFQTLLNHFHISLESNSWIMKTLSELIMAVTQRGNLGMWVHSDIIVMFLCCIICLNICFCCVDAFVVITLTMWRWVEKQTVEVLDLSNYL